MCKLLLRFLIFSLIFSLIACSNLIAKKESTYDEIQNNNLFNRIGGLPVLNKIVDEFIDEVAASPRTKRSFDGIPKNRPGLARASSDPVRIELCLLQPYAKAGLLTDQVF